MIKRAHLRQFLAVADTGSFTAAARRLNVTQPTLSAAIAELEKIGRAQLFVRDRRGIRLTEAGNRLLGHARAIEREFQQAESGLMGTLAPAVRPLRLGIVDSLASALVAQLATSYQACSDAKDPISRPLQISGGSDAELRRRLMSGRIDLALTLLRQDEAEADVLEEGYRLLVADGHRLAGSDILHPEELASDTMIARRTCEVLAETSRLFTQHGVRPHFLLRSADEDRCLALVRANLAVTTGPESLAGHGITAIQLHGYQLRRRVGLVAAPGTTMPERIILSWQSVLERVPSGLAVPC